MYTLIERMVINMKMKQTLIIGAGHAGQNLHLKTLKKLEINTLVGFVDNNIIKNKLHLLLAQSCFLHINRFHRLM